MIKQERRTVVKKMSNKDLLNILWLLENCKDVSDVDLTKLTYGIISSCELQSVTTSDGAIQLTGSWTEFILIMIAFIKKLLKFEKVCYLIMKIL